MPSSSCCLSCLVSETYALASFSRQISYADYCRLKVVLVSGLIEAEEKTVIQRLFHEIRRGWIQLVGIEQFSL